MDLSRKAIEEFKAIYREEFGKEISEDRAQEVGQNLLTLFALLCRRTPEEEKKESREQKRTHS